jgi:hypothetical protein
MMERKRRMMPWKARQMTVSLPETGSLQWRQNKEEPQAKRG